MKLILQAGADINAVNNKGETALALAAVHFPQSPEIVKLLLEAGADVNKPDNKWVTALMISKPESFWLLIEAGADIKAADNNGNTVLMYKYADLTMVKDLIKAGSDINSVNVNGWTALMRAAAGRGTEIAEEMISAGAVDYARNNDALQIFPRSANEIISKLE